MPAFHFDLSNVLVFGLGAACAASGYYVRTQVALAAPAKAAVEKIAEQLERLNITLARIEERLENSDDNLAKLEERVTRLERMARSS